jgi:hypothetical protein
MAVLWLICGPRGADVAAGGLAGERIA